MTFGSDTILNYQLSQKLKLIGISKFNYLIITLTVLIKISESCQYIYIYIIFKKLSPKQYISIDRQRTSQVLSLYSKFPTLYQTWRLPETFISTPRQKANIN